MLLTWFFVQLSMLIGGLNKIAQLCSVLFLLSYAIVNIACLGLYLASAPNFRPSFKYFSGVTCTLGVLGTATMMLMISPLYSGVCLLLYTSLILALNMLSPVKTNNWGSISQALLFHQVRKYLLLLDPRKEHVKFWRPQVLLLIKNPRTACSLVDFANTLKKGGLFVLGNVSNQSEDDRHHPDFCMLQHPHWLSLVDHLKVKAFIELTSSPTVRSGVQHLVRLSGIGAMKPNTILLGYLDGQTHDDEFLTSLSNYGTTEFEGIFPPVTGHKCDSKKISKEEYIGIIMDCLRLCKNVGLCRNFQKFNRQQGGGVDLNSAGKNVFRQFRNSDDKLYLDVWLVDFFSDSGTDITDTTSLFLLQLAFIVNQVMKRLSLRVFISPGMVTIAQSFLLLTFSW